MKSKDKNRISGIIGTILFHLLILAAFIFFGLSTPLPLPGEEGVEVNLGNFSQGAGNEQKPVVTESATPPPPQPIQPEQEVVEEENLTQDVEEAPMLEPEEIKEEKVEEEIVEKPVEEPPVEQPEEPEEEPEEPEVDPRALYKGKKESTDESSNEGITGDQGDQGMPTGTPEPKTYTGPGGEGEGVSFSLGGRGALRLPKPEYTSEEQGRVVVDIWVDRTGKVVRAEAGARGTNISDIDLWKQARDAALRSTFSSDPDAPSTQKGTITYNFIRLN